MTCLRCPECGSALSQGENTYVCTGCGQQFNRRWGIPIFNRNPDYYYSPVPKEWLKATLETYRPLVERGKSEYDRFLAELLNQIKDNSRKREWVDNVVTESRTFYKYLVPLNPDSHVLNLGCGWDNTTINLARSVRHVTAMDLTPERIQVLYLKSLYYGLDNIELVCGGDSELLPFENGCFDAVFLNGVLEWVASDWSSMERMHTGRSRYAKFFIYLFTSLFSQNPRKRQLQYLREVRRVLKPSGALYVGIENRYSRLYFGTRPDHHSMIWFGSLYPRLLAHVVSLTKHTRPYRTYTYSRSGYAKLSKDAGFRSMRTYGIEPMYRMPEVVFDLDKHDQIRYAKKSFWRRSFPSSDGIYKATVPSFGMIWSVGQDVESWVNAAARDFAESRGLKPDSVSVSSIRFSPKDKMNVFLTTRTGEEYLLKVPFTPMAEEQLNRNKLGIEGLRLLTKDNPEYAHLADLVPTCLGVRTIGNEKYFIETARKGLPWQKVPAEIEPILLEQLMQIFRDLGSLRLNGHESVFTPESCGNKLDFLQSLIPSDRTELASELNALREILAGRLDSHTCQSFFHKGDFTLGNTLCSGDRISGLIDFDEFQVTGGRFVNLADFMFSYFRLRHGIFWKETLKAILLERFDQLPDTFDLSKHLKTVGASPEDLKTAALLSWVNHAFHGLKWLRARYDRTAVQRLLVEGLDEFHLLRQQGNILH